MVLLNKSPLSFLVQCKSSHIKCYSTEAARTFGALSGIKVLDLTRILAGPFCTMMLADLGAEVIKVEKPGTGDETRLWGPPYVQDQACYFLAVNRNKKSISVDLKRPEGIEIIKRLASRSDLFVENYLPGKLNKMGLSYEDLKEINPKIVYCSITGFGSDGPYATRAGYDVIAASMGGLLSITGPADGEPCKVGVAITDLTTGLYAKGAIMAALFQRERTGIGCKVEANLLSTQVSVLANLGVNYLNTGIKAPRRGTAHETVVPYQAFKCHGDKWLTIGAGSDAMFKKLCVILFSQDEANKMIIDERFTTNAKRAQNRTQLIELLNEQFKRKPIKEWIAAFNGSGIAYGPVNDLDDVFEDEGVIHNRCVIETEHPVTGKVKLLGPAVKYQAASSNVSTFRESMLPPPLLGEHTEEVLKDVLGYDQDKVNLLTKTGVVYCKETK